MPVGVVDIEPYGRKDPLDCRVREVSAERIMPLSCLGASPIFVVWHSCTSALQRVKTNLRDHHSSTTPVIESGDNRGIVGGGGKPTAAVPLNPLDLQRFPAAIRFIP